ncbi:MAG: hypothetical protein ACJ8FY_27945 [Gemmataceae bacterium]
MIVMPRRSVTRFFIPLIDVLTLLFCIFLLLPLVKSSDEATMSAEMLSRDDKIRRLELEVESLRHQEKDLPQNLCDELERLRRERLQILQNRLAIRVLEIDAATGKLYYQDRNRYEIRDQADAQELIERDRLAKKGGGKELFYLVLYPRDPASVYPLREQRETYERWFKDVAHGFDVPGLAPEKGGAP